MRSAYEIFQDVLIGEEVTPDEMKTALIYYQIQATSHMEKAAWAIGGDKGDFVKEAFDQMESMPLEEVTAYVSGTEEFEAYAEEWRQEIARGLEAEIREKLKEFNGRN